MDILDLLKKRIVSIDITNQAALESVIYHLPIVFSDKTLPSVTVSFAAICISNFTTLLSSRTLQLSSIEISKIITLIRTLTNKINDTITHLEHMSLCQLIQLRN